MQNTMYRSRVKTMVKKARQSISNGTPDEATIRQALSLLDKASVKGIVHKNNAARNKSRLMKHLNSVSESNSA